MDKLGVTVPWLSITWISCQHCWFIFFYWKINIQYGLLEIYGIRIKENDQKNWDPRDVMIIIITKSFVNIIINIFFPFLFGIRNVYSIQQLNGGCLKSYTGTYNIHHTRYIPYNDNSFALWMMLSLIIHQISWKMKTVQFNHRVNSVQRSWRS